MGCIDFSMWHGTVAVPEGAIAPLSGMLQEQIVALAQRSRSLGCRPDALPPEERTEQDW